MFEGTAESDIFVGKWTSEQNDRRRATNAISMNYMMDPETEKVDISKDMYQKPWFSERAREAAQRGPGYNVLI